MLGDQRGVRVGDAIAGHRGVAHRLKELRPIEDPAYRVAGCRESLVVDRRILIQALGRDGEVDLAVDSWEVTSLSSHAVGVRPCLHVGLCSLAR